MGALYPFGKAEQARGNLDFLTDDMRAVFVDTDVYTYDPADKYVADLSGLQSESALLSSKTISDDAVMDAADTLFAGATGDESEAVVIFKDTGNPATDVVYAFVDGLSVILNGGDVTLIWHATGIAKL
jgi:hypothetical protein